MHRTFAIVSVAAASLASAQPFTQEAQTRGIDYRLRSHTWGFGAMFADLDMDGDPDILAVGGPSGVVGAWENDGAGSFTDRSKGTGIPTSFSYSTASAGDYDNDGDPDVYICNWNAPDIFLRNNGDFTFTDITGDAAIGDTGPATSASWMDYNADGWLDLYLCHRERTGAFENRLYRNNADGTFTDVAQDLGVADLRAMTFTSVMFDFDRDGDQDLYVSNGMGPTFNCQWPNRLFRNDAGAFTEIGEASGADVCAWGMSVGVGDFNRDLWPDVFVTNLNEPNSLLLNNADGTFTESAELSGTTTIGTGWSSQFADFDNDSYQDLFICEQTGPDYLYRHAGTWPAENIAQAMGVAHPGQSFSASIADVDGDGDLDLLRASNNQTLALYINNEGTNRNWIRVRTLGRSGHPTPGTTIEILDSTGVRQLAEVVYNAGYKSQNELVLHFGLDTATSIDELVIRWPDGIERTFTNAAPNQTILARHCAADTDGDGDVDAEDFFTYLDAFAGALSWADWDANGSTDSDDFFAYLNDFVSGCP